MSDLTDAVAEARQATGTAPAPPAQALRATLRGIGAVIGPTSVVLALLYYFGWVRTSYEAHMLGLDDTLLGYTTQDYLLRSISPLEGPMLVGIAAMLVALGVHHQIVSRAGAASEDAERKAALARQIRILAVILGASGIVLVVLGLIGSQVDRPSRFVSLWAPLSLAIGIALLSYGIHLYNRFVSRLPSAASGREIAGVNLVAAGLMSALLLLCILRAVSHYAAIRGIELAAEVERILPNQPDVTIFSAKRLGLQPSVIETEVTGDDTAYRYKYTGLKLLFRTDRRFFLRPSDPADNRNIIIAESPDTRVEFAPAL